MCRFWLFCLKLPIHAPFYGVFGAYFPHVTRPPKGPSLGANMSFEPFSVRISAMVRPGCIMKKKYRTTKSVIFPLFGGKPSLD